MTLEWQRAAAVADRLVQGWRQPGAPGGAIVLFDARQVHSTHCAGLADLAQQTPFTLDSVVRFASITKHLFAALATGPGRRYLSPDDKLADHLPQLRGANGQVTVGLALDMSSGLPDLRETLSLIGLSVYNATTDADLLAFLAAESELNYPPGSEISYTNTGYRLVEEALKAKGVRFDALLQQYICQPLDISLTAPETWFDVVPGLAPGYWFDGSRWQLASAGLHLSASGSVAGSLRHLTRWLQALLSDGGPGTGVLRRLSAPRLLADGRVSGYGLGLASTQIGTQTLFGHGGSHAGYKSYFLLHPERQAGVALVANREDAATSEAALRVMAALLNRTLPEKGHDLTHGLYVGEHEAEWLEIAGDAATWLGASETLWRGGAQGEAHSLSSTFPLRLRQEGVAIGGEIGHAPRRFVPAQPDGASLQAMQGRWFLPQWRSELVIEGGKLTMGIGPAAIVASLQSLGGDRVLATAQDGPWQKRFMLKRDGSRLRLLLNRSRVVQFMR
ncbi:MAG: serine hydrolase domain-containing protein [Pantoea sp.]|uniref:Serine hydrolase n=1 Tax=Pantoea septica TaxID=472695 RepID=A0ABX3UW66_9GAMM|nr:MULTISPECIES: serine hydrolase domain-containing protein [Pantoea]MDU5781450.1 serine hydrolase domain-containing protein [Pantoea sp.]ORN02341.1 serine hydrolase [Pantoea septica]